MTYGNYFFTPTVVNYRWIYPTVVNYYSKYTTHKKNSSGS